MYHISKLKNGITLISIPLKGTRAATVLAMFPVGSRYETRHLSGAAHFVEHMLFKGTLKRPEATDISRTLEAVGAEYNAFTNKDYTGYYVKIAGDKQEIAYDLLSDMLYHSVLAAEEVEKEKGAIVEELRMYKDNPSMAVDLLADELNFGDCPLGWDIGGTEQTVRGLSREDLFGYYQTHYSPKNMVLVVSGAVQSSQIKKLVAAFAEKRAPEKSHSFSFYKEHFEKFIWPEKSVALEHRVAVAQKKVDQTQVILSFRGLPNNHPDRFAASIMLNILGVGMSSRLFVEVREKRGLAYMIRAGSSSYRDVGVSYIQAGLDPARLGEALQVIKGEILRLAAEPITKQELADAKSSLSGRLALSLEDSSTQAEWFAKQVMFGKKIQTPDDIVRAFNKVTVKQVQSVAEKILQWDEVRLAAIGPFTKEQVIKLLP